MEHPTALPIDQLLRDCTVTRTRRGGPGGQHRNKVATAVVITHRPTGIIAEASERRSQVQNQSEAIFRLRVELALRVRSARQSVSAMWTHRTADGTIALNPSHDDYPAMLAEALDTIDACGADVKAAADRLGVSPTQLIKLLKTIPRALGQVNDARKARHMHALH
jgi:hypothetical protein